MGSVPALSIAINVGIAVLAPFGWLQIALGKGASLADTGVASLKYFTVLSNLFAAVVSGAYACLGLLGAAVPTWLVVARLVATVGLMVTLLTVVAILNSLYGWRAMYAGGNLWLHLIVPLLALVDCLLFVPLGQLTLGQTLWCAVPVLLYGAWYLRRILACTDDAERAHLDFYGFCRWGVDKVYVVYAVMLGFSWGLGVLIWLANRALAGVL